MSAIMDGIYEIYTISTDTLRLHLNWTFTVLFRQNFHCSLYWEITQKMKLEIPGYQQTKMLWELYWEMWIEVLKSFIFKKLTTKFKFQLEHCVLCTSVRFSFHFTEIFWFPKILHAISFNSAITVYAVNNTKKSMEYLCAKFLRHIIFLDDKFHLTA